jgi:hypothetical protein
MPHDHPVHTDRYVPARTNDGWGAAAATIALALVLIAGATVIHKRTYKPPTDPSWQAAGQQPASKVPRGH